MKTDNSASQPSSPNIERADPMAVEGKSFFTAEEKKRTLEETDRALANGGGVGAFCASRTASAPSKTLVDFASPFSDGTTTSITTPAWA